MCASTTDPGKNAESRATTDGNGKTDDATSAAFREEESWLNLRADEEVLWMGRPHIYPVLHWILLPVLFGIGVAWAIRTYDPTGMFLTASVAVAVLAITVAIWVYIKRAAVKYIITNSGMYERRGVFSEVVTHVHLSRVQNTRYRQSAFGRLVGFGNVSVYTAGTAAKELKYECVRNPGEIDALIGRQLDHNEFAEGR